MKLNKIAATMILASVGFASLNAQAITVDGVTWNQFFGNDFSAKSNLFELTSGNAGDTVSGYGFINQINGKNYGTSGSFLPGTAELTYEFGGFTLLAAANQGVGSFAGFGTGIESNNGSFMFTGGWLNVYINGTVLGPNGHIPGAAFTSFDETNKSTATDGELWVSMLASSAFYGGGVTLKGSVTGKNSVGLSGQGVGYFDVLGGPAAASLNTNSEPGASDFTYTSEFQALDAAYADANAQGNNTIFGKTARVPEPGSIALVGLGLLGLCFGRRNKKAA